MYRSGSAWNVTNTTYTIDRRPLRGPGEIRGPSDTIDRRLLWGPSAFAVRRITIDRRPLWGSNDRRLLWGPSAFAVRRITVDRRPLPGPRCVRGTTFVLIEATKLSRSRSINFNRAIRWLEGVFEEQDSWVVIRAGDSKGFDCLRGESNRNGGPLAVFFANRGSLEVPGLSPRPFETKLNHWMEKDWLVTCYLRT